MMSTPAGRSLPIALVVEDEALLRILAVEVVEEAGFTAIEARDADEAVVLLESRTDITLLFTDDQYARQYGWAKIGPCGARPLAPDQDLGCVGQPTTSILRSADGQLLCRKALPSVGVGR